MHVKSLAGAAPRRMVKALGRDLSFRLYGDAPMADGKNWVPGGGPRALLRRGGRDDHALFPRAQEADPDLWVDVEHVVDELVEARYCRYCRQAVPIRR
jgi:hypothetical protein